MSHPHQLPIYPAKKCILHAIDHNQVTILVAQTGSGKTTQLPRYLIQAGYCINNNRIVISVPRRIAAVSIAKRVSQQLMVNNNQIAHHVRFNSTVKQNSQVIFMTDGMLVQQLYSDCMLEKYSVIILDDVHEKSVNFQILFGFIKKILLKRNNVKLIITSATLQTKKIEAFFLKKVDYRQQKLLTVQTLQIPGRIHKVKLHYLKQNTKNYLLKAFQTLIYLDRETSSGTILVFLSSVEEIEAMSFMLDSYAQENRRKFKVIELHSKMPLEKQNQIFQYENNLRKIILSTNLAESSITIPDVQYVVDCGLVKIKVYDTDKNLQKMKTVQCGKSAAIQRAGRAGRVTDGQCYRIYTEAGFNKMNDNVLAQVQRVQLTNFIIKLMSLGIKDLLNFQMIDRPPEQNITRAIETLYAYQLIDADFNLTSKGERCGELSLDIRSASMLLNSFDQKFGCSKQILMLVSMLEVHQQLFTNNRLALLKAKKRIGCKEGDFLTLINIFIRYARAKFGEKRKICSELKLRQNSMEHVLQIHDNLLGTIKKFRRFRTSEEELKYKYGDQQDLSQKNKFISFDLKSSSDQYQAILRCILTGYFTNIAQLQSDGTYYNIRSKQKLQIHPTSLVSVTYPKWIVYHQILKTSTGYYVHNASVIESQWIFQLVGHYYEDKRKEQLKQKFNKDKEKQGQQEVQKMREQLYGNKNNQKEKNDEDEDDNINSKLVQIGGKKIKPQLFNTKVLGLKNIKSETLKSNMKKKNKLSFQEDFDI